MDGVEDGGSKKSSKCCFSHLDCKKGKSPAARREGTLFFSPFSSFASFLRAQQGRFIGGKLIDFERERERPCHGNKNGNEGNTVRYPERENKKANEY